MKVMIAEDNLATRLALTEMVAAWGFEVHSACDGLDAWQQLQPAQSPRLLIVDWMMPRLDGLELCRRVRRSVPGPAYIILLTARDDPKDIIVGLEEGADEYLTKPVSDDELRARINAGRRILQLQQTLADRIRELEQAAARVHQLQQLLPICCYCKKIRDDKDYWRQLEEYF